jgi:hypothetical protein
MAYFEHLFGMKINYRKSDMTTINLEEEETLQFARIFCCKLSSFPFKYYVFDMWIIGDSAHVLLFPSHNHDMQTQLPKGGDKAYDIYEKKNSISKLV